MKKTVRKIAVAVLAVVIFTALATTAYASHANIDFKDISISYASFCHIEQVGDKDNDTPLYINIENKYVAQAYRVRALGCIFNGEQRVNLTYSNGELCDSVLCSVGTDYSVHSLIYERGYGYATLELMACGPTCNTSGKWSPDSVGTYTSAKP